jgi:hypothetical protein
MWDAEMSLVAGTAAVLWTVLSQLMCMHRAMLCRHALAAAGNPASSGGRLPAAHPGARGGARLRVHSSWGPRRQQQSSTSSSTSSR